MRDSLVDPQVNKVTVPSRPERVNSVQKNAFLDRRVRAEAFFDSLQENAYENSAWVISL